MLIVTTVMSMILVNNYVLAQFLGICPFLGVSKKLDSAVGMGVAVIFVMVLATIAIPSLHKALGVYLPLITTNCAVLGVCISNIDAGYGYVLSIFNAAGAGIGFLLAMVLFAGVRGKLENEDGVPYAFRGVPLTLITAAMLSLGFMGFSGLFQ